MQRQDLFNSWIAIDPAHAGRGIGRALLPHAEARTRARRGSRLYIDTFAENTAARELFEQSGYREARRHYRMQIDFDERPAEPAGSDGITYSNFDRERDARGFYDALNESFAGQWGFRTLPFEEWVRIRLDGPDFDPSIWFVARDGDEVVGILRGESRRWGGGWVGMIGVRPVWQRRGVGSRLLAAAFRAFYDRGERHVGLGVDTENPTGATRVYERAGMRVVQEMITYAKELT